MNIKFIKLDTVCSTITDGSHYSPKSVDIGYPMLSVKDMRDYGFDYSNCNHITEVDFEIMKKNGCVPLLNDVLIAKDGSYLKEIFVVTEYREQAILSSIGILRPKIDLVNPYFLKYYLSTEYVKRQVGRKYVSGSALPRIILKNFKDIDIPNVSLVRQNSIVNSLKLIDDKIIINKHINDNLQQQLESIYDHYFMQYSSDDKLSHNYTKALCKNILEVKTGKQDANFSTLDGKYKFFTCSKDTLYCDEPAFSGHSVLIAGNGDFNVKHFSGEFNAYQRTYVLIPNDTKYYGALYMASLKLVNRFKRASSGSIVKFISKSDVDNIELIIPNDEKLLESLNNYIFAIEKRQEEIEQLENLRNLLLPMLMNGQISII